MPAERGHIRGTGSSRTSAATARQHTGPARRGEARGRGPAHAGVRRPESHDSQADARRTSSSAREPHWAARGRRARAGNPAARRPPCYHAPAFDPAIVAPAGAATPSRPQQGALHEAVAHLPRPRRPGGGPVHGRPRPRRGARERPRQVQVEHRGPVRVRGGVDQGEGRHRRPHPEAGRVPGQARRLGRGVLHSAQGHRGPRQGPHPARGLRQHAQRRGQAHRPHARDEPGGLAARRAVLVRDLVPAARDPRARRRTPSAPPRRRSPRPRG